MDCCGERRKRPPRIGTVADSTSELERPAQMRDHDIISDKEFKAKSKELLGDQ